MPYKGLQANLAWAAGFVDGEGCFTHQWIETLKDGTVYRYPKMCISQSGTDELLKRFREIVGVGTVREAGGQHKTAKKPRYVYNAHGFDAVQQVYSMLYQYLGLVKREQGKKVLDLFLLHKHRNLRRTK